MLPGLVQWFAFEDRDSVERAAAALIELKVTELRTLFSWADWTRAGGPAWFDWFIGTLASVPNLTLLPSLFYTPPHLARKDADGNQRTSYPPEDLDAYADFAATMIERYGTRFDWVQLWNEPNWKPYWDWELDPDASLFAQMMIPAAACAHAHGKRVALGGTTPLDYAWLARTEELGLLGAVDAVAFHYSPSWDDQHRRWMPLPTEIFALRSLLRGFGRSCEVWLDESGISTHTRSDAREDALEHMQVTFFDEIRTLPVERAYWFALFDQPEHIKTDDTINTGTPPDPTAYHFGLIDTNGRKKPLYAHWKAIVEKETSLQH